MLTPALADGILKKGSPWKTMSQDQLSALVAELHNDHPLKEKLLKAADLAEASGLAKEAGFDVSQADWLKAFQALSDEELAVVAGAAHLDEAWTDLVNKNRMSPMEAYLKSSIR
jgi:predicted ribosomally synthesized peptide with nif11-like leader